MCEREKERKSWCNIGCRVIVNSYSPVGRTLRFSESQMAWLLLYLFAAYNGPGLLLLLLLLFLYYLEKKSGGDKPGQVVPIQSGAWEKNLVSFFFREVPRRACCQHVIALRCATSVAVATTSIIKRTVAVYMASSSISIYSRFPSGTNNPTKWRLIRSPFLPPNHSRINCRIWVK